MSVETSHTPGPWIIRGVSQEDGSISFGSEKFRIVIGYVTNAASIGDFVKESFERGTFGSPDAAHTQWANARLCASAPEMLAALKNVVEVWGATQTLYGDTIEQMRRAIEKAEGKEPALSGGAA